MGSKCDIELIVQGSGGTESMDKIGAIVDAVEKMRENEESSFDLVCFCDEALSYMTESQTLTDLTVLLNTWFNVVEK